MEEHPDGSARLGLKETLLVLFAVALGFGIAVVGAWIGNKGIEDLGVLAAFFTTFGFAIWRSRATAARRRRKH